MKPATVNLLLNPDTSNPLNQLSVRVTIGRNSFQTPKVPKQTPQWMGEGLEFTEILPGNQFIILELWEHDVATQKEAVLGGGCFRLEDLFNHKFVDQLVPLFYDNAKIAELRVLMEFIPDFDESFMVNPTESHNQSGFSHGQGEQQRRPIKNEMFGPSPHDMYRFFPPPHPMVFPLPPPPGLIPIGFPLTPHHFAPHPRLSHGPLPYGDLQLMPVQLPPDTLTKSLEGQKILEPPAGPGEDGDQQSKSTYVPERNDRPNQSVPILLFPPPPPPFPIGLIPGPHFLPPPPIQIIPPPFPPGGRLHSIVHPIML